MRLRVLLLLLTFFGISHSQGRYFVDGYHGGVYGHYPLKWKTQFIVDNVKKHPLWRIGLEIEPETWDSVKVVTPKAYREFAAMLAGNQIEFTNPAYAQPYCYNISGESIIRQFRYGIDKMHSHFPDVKFSTYSVEEPCFTSCLPMILSQFGFKYASLKCPNTCWGGYSAPFGGELVNWIGPDGSSLLTVPRYACEKLEENSTWQTTAWHNSESYFAACEEYGIKNAVGMCYQDAGWRNGPWLKHPKDTKYVLWTDYFETIADRELVTDYKFSQEDVRVNLMWGSQVMQRIGREVRQAENELVMAEKVCAIAYLDRGYEADAAQIDEAWRTLMLSQHHDSWIVPYNGLKSYGTWADAIKQWTDASIDIAQNAVRNSLSATPGGEIRVVNTQGIARSEVVAVVLPKRMQGAEISVSDRNGRKVASAQEDNTLYFEAKVPAFGYTTYRIEQTGRKSESQKGKIVHGGIYKLENDQYSITFDLDRGGVVTSLVAKGCGKREFVDNTNEYKFGEMRGYFYDRQRFESTVDSRAQLEVITDNDLLKRVRICGKIAGHPFSKTITLAKGDRKIGVDLQIDWKHNEGIGEYREKKWAADRRSYCDDRYKLSVMFPTNLPETELYKNAPFDVCKSTQSSTFFNRWSEIKHNVILNWVDLVAKDGNYGLALFSDHTTSYGHGEDYPLSLTVQYSGVGLWGRNYAITQSTELHYDIMPHRGKWQQAAVSEVSDAINEPLQTAWVSDNSLSEKSYIQLPKGIMVSAARIENGKVVVRFYNGSGSTGKHRIKLAMPVEVVDEVNLLGERVQSLTVNSRGNGENEVEFEMPLFGIKTLEIAIK